MSDNGSNEDRVAVLVDCDNTSPEILEYALSVVAQFGRVVVRRGYGNHATLANKWQEALVRLAFTPKKYGHAGLLEMVETYPDLQIRNQGLAHWVKPKEAAVKPQ